MILLLLLGVPHAQYNFIPIVQIEHRQSIRVCHGLSTIVQLDSTGGKSTFEMSEDSVTKTRNGQSNGQVGDLND